MENKKNTFLVRCLFFKCCTVNILRVLNVVLKKSFKINKDLLFKKWIGVSVPLHALKVFVDVVS